MRLSPLVVCLCLVADGCVVSNRVSFGSQNTPRPRVRQTIGLGVQTIDAANGFTASMVLTDSVLHDLGWSMASVNRERNEMATQWLYLEGPIFDAAHVHECGAASDVGVRLTFAPTTRGDSARYSVRGEMLITDRAPADAERTARDGFAVAVTKLRVALAQPMLDTDSLDVRARNVSGEGRIATTHAWSACSTVLVPRASP
jgi:hypothetical protein